MGIAPGPWLHLRDGTQRVGLFTDQNGRIVLPNLPTHLVMVWARLGGREAEGTSEWGDFLELQLPAPK